MWSLCTWARVAPGVPRRGAAGLGMLVFTSSGDPTALWGQCCPPRVLPSPPLSPRHLVPDVRVGIEDPLIDSHQWLGAQ